MPGLKDVVGRICSSAPGFSSAAPAPSFLGISIVLWFLAAYPKAFGGRYTHGSSSRRAFAGRAGHALEPAIKPLGFDWQIGIGLISSFAAREDFCFHDGRRLQCRDQG